jgi:CubicO group peptidase (beta-lactamase class C family)
MVRNSVTDLPGLQFLPMPETNSFFASSCLQKIFIAFAIFLVNSTSGYAQNEQTGSLSNVRELEQFLDTIFMKEMEKGRIPGAVISIVRDGNILFSKGYGFANLEKKTPVEPDKTIFRIGSITKVFTAAAVLQLAEKKVLKLKDDVNDHLKAFRVPETSQEPVRISHLLTHSAGFDEISRNRMVDSEDQAIPLGSFLKDRLVRIRPAGQVSSYNTYGISLAGYLVEQLSGQALKDYFQQKIFRPLQMSSTHLGTVPPELFSRMATGYVPAKEGGYTPLGFVWFNTYPASDINSTATDMAHFMIALLGDGSYGKGRILRSKMKEQMLVRQHSNHPAIPGWTYGLQVSRTINGEGGLEHGGSMDDGFSSLLYLMPQHGIGIFMAGTKESTNIHDQVKEAFVKKYFPMKDKPVLRQPPEELKKGLEKFEGSFRWDPFCHSCGDSSALRAQSVKIVASNGMLSFWGGKWAQVEPLLFQLADGVLAGQVHVAFREDPQGKITHMFLGGPWTYEK